MRGDRRTIVKGREEYQLAGKCTGLRVYLYIIIRPRVVTQISIFLDTFVDGEIEFK